MKYLLSIIVFSTALRCRAQIPGFTLTGSPTSSAGATWSYQATVNGVIYDLQGILFKPNGTSSTYPAVIINHGTGGNVNSYSKAIAKEMVKWNYVCIATNLCHAVNVPQGAPGFSTSAFYGASVENMQRSMKCWDILSKLGYVDTSCIATFGHSRGAWVTTAIAGTYPQKFAVVAHSAGGVHDQAGSTLPTTTMGNGITAPYQMHHGDNDNTVPLAYDIALDSILNLNGVSHQLYIYPGYTHSQISMDSLMLVRTKNFFTLNQCKIITSVEENSLKKSTIIYPNPVNDKLYIESTGSSFYISDITGEVLINGDIENNKGCIDTWTLVPGIYLIEISEGKNRSTAKFAKAQ